jgi:predicted acylesterase/phospholipase RssA
MMQPAYGEYFRRSAMLPLMAMSAAWQFTWGRKSLLRTMESFAPALPTGLFSNDNIDIALSQLFSRKGRTNDFRELKSRLTLVATHLDSAEAAPFGSPGWDHVPISKAVQASAALPGLFPPVEIDGQHYVDGALKKTMHASVALDAGVDLMICLNPLVPFNANTLTGKIPRSADGGLPAVLSQSLRSMIHSRMELGMKHYERAYPDTDIILIEPDHHDPELYLANTFSYAQRRHLAEHAYQQTRRMLRTDDGTLAKKLERHGVHINQVVVADACRRLIRPAITMHPGATAVAIQNLGNTLNQLGTRLGTLQHQRHG